MKAAVLWKTGGALIQVGCGLPLVSTLYSFPLRRFTVTNLSRFPALEYDVSLRAQPTLGTTMEYAQVATTSRERYMRAAQTELAKFERHEIEFRKKDQQERAAELDLPLPRGKQH